MTDERRRLIQKALTSDDASDFLPTIVAAEFIKYVRDRNVMRQNFRTIPMPSATFNVPRVATGMSMYFVSEGTTAPQTEIASGVMALVAKKLFAQVLVNIELIEDATADMAALLREDFIDAMARGEERAMIQGDDDHTPTTATEGSATSTTWYELDTRLAFNGALALAEAGAAPDAIAAGSANMTTSHINQMRYALGKYGRYATDLVAIINPVSAKHLREDEKIVTIDKFGPQATIKKGFVTTVYGIPVIESGHVPDGYAFCCPVWNLVIGDRRQVKVKEEEEIASDQQRIVISERIAFNIRQPDAIIEISGLQEDAAS